MRLVMVIKGNATKPQRFWDRRPINVDELEDYKRLGYVVSADQSDVKEWNKEHGYEDNNGL